MTYRNVREKATKKAKAKNKKQKAKPKSDFVDTIEDGAGVFKVNGINVQRGTRGELMPTWVQDNHRYHINIRGGDRDDVFHVTRESNPRIQYFFRGSGASIEGVQPNPRERGKSTQRDPATDQKVSTKRSFGDLPDDVQTFVKKHWDDIFG